MSRDPLLYVADIVAAGEAILRYTDGVTFDAFASNDEKRSAVERQVFIIGEAAARLPEDWKLLRPEVPWRKIVGLRNLSRTGLVRLTQAGGLGRAPEDHLTHPDQRSWSGAEGGTRTPTVLLPPAPQAGCVCHFDQYHTA